MSNDAPWDNHHRHSSFLESIEDNLSDVYLPNVVYYFTSSIFIHEVNFKKNLSNTEEAIPLDIYIKPSIVENIHTSTSCYPSEIETYTAPFKEFRDVFSWTYEEIPGIDPNIVVHDIKMYLDVKLVRKHLHWVHPNKAAMIKMKLKNSFVLVSSTPFLSPIGCQILSLS